MLSGIKPPSIIPLLFRQHASQISCEESPTEEPGKPRRKISPKAALDSWLPDSSLPFV